MLPSVLAEQIQQGVKDFLRTTFPVATPAFKGLIDSITENDGLFRGPYLDLKLPFEEGRIGTDFFPAVPMAFSPYRHQELAFQRLGGPHPASTLIATGTGSGKTECFLLPLLDHCHRHQGEPGIKAILIYPMNALASDQAGRIAKAIWTNPALKGKLRVGLYIGDQARQTHQEMGPNHVITDRDTLRLSPPDILLTNYKMLDYLLIRPRDAALWKENTPESLRYLVVDELHTFDGAQGTDLACLVRRLTDRLQTPTGHLCCVGTSATLGDDRETDKLCAYASKVFNTPFTRDAVITEARKTSEAFLRDSLISRFDIVPPAQASALDPEAYEDDVAYLHRQAALWFGLDIPPEAFSEMPWRVDLGRRLKEHSLFRNLLTILGGRIKSYDEILERLAQATDALQGTPRAYQVDLLNSFVALIATARRVIQTTNADGTLQAVYLPLVNVRCQLWMRELRRMVARVDNKNATLAFSDDLTEETRKGHLPVVHCRECGSTGWAGLLRTNRSTVEHDLQAFYVAYFNEAPETTFLFPLADTDEPDPRADTRHLCTYCLTLTTEPHPTACDLCDNTHLVRVRVSNERRKKGKRTVVDHHCPYCEGKDSLTILGSRAASLCSVIIAQLYASAYSRDAVHGDHDPGGDKKLITFSDSVQDASHRAAFFGARTYRFTLRAAIQQCLDSLEAPITLAELPGHFNRYWGGRLEDPAYLSTFIAPNMTWMEQWDMLTRTGSLPPNSTLKQRVNQRISWEIYSEYGFRSRIGRTLEKSGVSVAMPDEARLIEAARWLTTVLINEVGEMTALTEATVLRFIRGLLEHMKQKGAIYHDELDTYVASGGNSYMLNRNYTLPGFGGRRIPIFVTSRARSSFDPLRRKSKTARTWYEAWAERCFHQEVPVIDSLHDALWHHIMKALEEQGLLERCQDNQNGEVWGLPPDVLVLHREVTQIQCATCGHSTSVARDAEDDWQAMPCLRYGCPGSYQPIAQADALQSHYYGALYQHGDIQRLFPAEHTGLLTRDDRETLERTFKVREHPWHPNLISCTPTLELGIDIGDLSNVLLCSVPPAQANYLQRIGRAGRKDGNALNITVANARPHDLYFYADPVQMMDGYVEPPGVFLDAPAILERQLMAYCFDRWVATGLSVGAIPSRLGQVLDRLDQTDPPAFPHTLFRFIEQHRTLLFERFQALFADTLTEASVAYLRRYFEGDDATEGSLPWKVLMGLSEVQEERASLKKKIRQLRDQIRKLEQGPKDLNYDQNLADLKRERQAFNDIIRKQINERNTYNFFTDEGLLPNYAFPEAGVTLHSIIYRKKEKVEQGEKQYAIWTYDYERPSVSAISELAPGNVFYAGGRAVSVNQIDLDVSKPEVWRLCPNCSYLDARHTDQAACPRCGTPEWADTAQQHEMVALRQVFANTSDKESRRGDDSDDRDNKFYVKETLVNFDDQDVTEAYRLDVASLPYGFEFIKRITLREINFGERGGTGKDISIAGKEEVRPGFQVCSQCGRVAARNGKIDHAFSCPVRARPEKDTDRRSLFLYRSFHSEAIRMLLPVTTFAGSERKLHSFVAALQVGLKRYFEGQIDHLKITLQDEPVEGAVYRKRYLVLYDQVPGGTGFLKNLMRTPDELMQVFREALIVLTACSCDDGCYRCLFAYRTSYNMEDISRHTAIDLLSSIVQHRERLVAIENLRKVDVNALFDSELEARFIEALRASRTKDNPVTVKAEVVHGKPGYLVTLGEQRYKVELQVSIGEKEGVVVPMKADFVFWPVRDAAGQRPVVVFTDGYTYHKHRIGLDMAQRMALSRSGNYRVWSITYRDVVRESQSQAKHFHNYLEARTDLPGQSFYDTLLHAYDTRYGTGRLKKARLEDSFTWLLRYLREPDDPLWSSYAMLHGLLRVDARRFAQPEEQAHWKAQRSTLLPSSWPDTQSLDQVATLLGLDEQSASATAPYVGLLVRVAQGAVQKGDPTQVEVIGYLDDRKADSFYKTFERYWSGFLRLYNLFQFIPDAYFVTARGLEEGVFDPLIPSAPVAIQALDPLWQEAFAYTPQDIHAVMDKLVAQAWPVPEVGYEALSDAEAVMATAELAWPAHKIAILRPEEMDASPYFERNGWQVVALSELLQDFDAAMPHKP